MKFNDHTSRRNFIKTGGKATLAAGLSASVLSSFGKDLQQGAYHFQKENTPFTQTPLPYDYKALEPSIDAMTMEIHYTKHAAAYASNLQAAIKDENVNAKSLEEVLGKVSKYSAKMRNNGGGHYNHELFWKVMSPSGGNNPSGKLADAITSTFGSFETFKTQFSDAGKNRFGSGWAWLLVDNDKKLRISSTPNQDNPLMDVSEIKGFPILGLDVWEHAYYLRYQNKRPDYINNWWKVVNWKYVQDRYESVA